MSRTHHIDNDEPLFQFDDSFDDSLSTDISLHFPQLSSLSSSYHPISSFEQHPISDELEDTTAHDTDKGKSVLQPVPIPNTTTTDAEHDVFDLSPFSTGPSTRANPH